MTAFQEVINSNKPVLVDFFATWCGPCQMLSHVLVEVKGVLADQVKIIKIDVDKYEDLASQYQVRGVPTMMIFKNGEMLWRQSGVLSKNDLVSKLKQYI
jgi:thioredoxin 1